MNISGLCPDFSTTFVVLIHNHYGLYFEEASASVLDSRLNLRFRTFRVSQSPGITNDALQYLNVCFPQCFSKHHAALSHLGGLIGKLRPSNGLCMRMLHTQLTIHIFPRCCLISLQSSNIQSLNSLLLSWTLYFKIRYSSFRRSALTSCLSIFTRTLFHLS